MRSSSPSPRCPRISSRAASGSSAGSRSGSRRSPSRCRTRCTPARCSPIRQWVGRDAMLLAYSSGWVIVPGALVGIAYALVRPRTRAEIGFAVTTLALAGALLLEAAQIADTDSQRFQERYLFVLVPLLAIAFGLYVRRGLPQKVP